jgi:hypothetical protein
MSRGVGLYRSTDGAETWEKVNTSLPLLYPKDFDVHPRDSRKISIGACDAGWGDHSGGLYRTDDSGRTWRRIGRQGPQTFGGYFHPKRDGWIYMTLTEGAPGAGLWLSRDDGRTWRPFSELPFSNIQRVAFDAADPTRMYVTTFGGSVWRGPVAPRQGRKVVAREGGGGVTKSGWCLAGWAPTPQELVSGLPGPDWVDKRLTSA